MSYEFTAPPAGYFIKCNKCHRKIGNDEFNFVALNQCECGGYYVLKEVKEAIKELKRHGMNPELLKYIWSD